MSGTARNSFSHCALDARDLTGQVKKVGAESFATGGFSELFRGMFVDPITKETTEVGSLSFYLGTVLIFYSRWRSRS
jgi:hypothetical protein